MKQANPEIDVRAKQKNLVNFINKLLINANKNIPVACYYSRVLVTMEEKFVFIFLHPHSQASGATLKERLWRASLNHQVFPSDQSDNEVVYSFLFGSYLAVLRYR